MAQDSALVTAANALPAQQFESSYVQGALRSAEISQDLALDFYSSAHLGDGLRNACLALIEHTSSDAYRQSSIGWNPVDKLEELADPAMRFLILRDVASSSLAGFASFMICCEDGLDTIYCYEIHLEERLRGRGLGAQLMGALEAIGRAVGVEKAMLTVFTSNVSARRFYQALGYELYDEEDVPSPKRLRGRKTPKPEPSYLIMAKDLLDR